MSDKQSSERAARNEARFRDANEDIDDKRESLHIEGRTPFLCECGNPGCTELIQLTVEEYEHVRSRPTWFAVVADHTDAAADRTVEDRGSWRVIEKSGLAGRIAEAEDPRG